MSLFLDFFSAISGDYPRAGQRGIFSTSVKKGKQRAGEGIWLWRKTEAHWRGARSNSAYGVRCGIFAVKLEAFVLGSSAFHGMRKIPVPLRGSYLLIHSALPEHLLCVGQKEYVVSRADIIIAFMS